MERELLNSVKPVNKGSQQKTERHIGSKIGIRNIGIALLGFLIASTTMLGEISPFTAAFTASLSGFDCISGFVGCVVGFFINGKLLESITMVSALLSIVAVRMFVGNRHAKWADIFTCVITGTSVFLANFLTIQKTSDMLLISGFAVISAATNYVLLHFQRIVLNRNTTDFTNPMNFLSIATVYVISIGICSNFGINIFNLGTTLSVVAILYFGNKYGFGMGATCGVLSTLGLAFTMDYFAITAIIFSLSGMAGGIFSKKEKITVASAFILTSSLCGALFGMNDNMLSLLANVFAGGAIYMIVPFKTIATQITAKPKETTGIKMQQIFAHRLRFAESTLRDVKETVDKTAKSLDRKQITDISWVYNSACDKVCRRCRLNMTCWGENYNDNTKYFNSLMRDLRKGKIALAENLPQSIQTRCHNQQSLVSQINNQYREFVGISGANRRITQMRSILTTQLDSTEKLLAQISSDMEKNEHFDTLSALRVTRTLEDYGCENPISSAIVGENGKMRIEVFSKTGFCGKPEEICEVISTSLHREFDLPDIVKTNDDYRLTMFERACYCIEMESTQISKQNGKVSGDYLDSFADGTGIAYVILSDGMGSGGRARVDSAFACGMLIKLLQAGVGIEAGLAIINLSLLVKSSDESFATLDICKIDLYNGNVELYKAGSASTFIKCGNSTAKCCGKGLPVGVSDNAVFEKQSFQLGNNDLVVMTSDGAEINEKWLYREMLKSDISVKELAESVADNARFSAEKERLNKGDDISVIAFRIKK